MWHPELVERLVTMASAHPELTMRNMDAEQSKRCTCAQSRRQQMLHTFHICAAAKIGDPCVGHAVTQAAADVSKSHLWRSKQVHFELYPSRSA